MQFHENVRNTRFMMIKSLASCTEYYREIFIHIIDDDVNEDFPIVFRANNNTMKSEIKCVNRINFSNRT